MPPTLRRAKPQCVGYTPFAVRNIEDGETVHQACLLVTGQCHCFADASDKDYVSVTCTDDFPSTERPVTQHWPVANGTWKALILLSPGGNSLDFKLHHYGGVSGTHKVAVNYLPLLQTPPLHLAIMVAKDSPLLIDCPPTKQGAISSGHGGLDAAIAKFRTTAYMWQALTAEDMREKGLDRRSFRLEEEWSVQTTSREAFQQFPNQQARSGVVPRVHIVRSDKTVAELRDPHRAQQKSAARDPNALHRFFEDALRSYGGPFSSNNRPVVAGLILDSSYSVESDLIHAHAALGCHQPDGISLGVFGSHLTYSWPRFFEEILECLTDQTPTGDTVGNDNGECNTLRHACFVGQGAFLHEVGHAFGAEHTTGIMTRGYSKHWARNFVADKEQTNDAKWDLQDALRFRVMPHFRMPGDEPISRPIARATLEIKPFFDGESDGLSVDCAIGLAWVDITHDGQTKRSELMNWKDPCKNLRFLDVYQRYERSKPLSIRALAMNGKERIVSDVWRLFKQSSFLRISGSDVALRKQSVRSGTLENDDNNQDKYCEWAMLLKEKGSDEKLYRATAIDLRVGCIMDGAVVYYEDGHRTNCGPANKRHFGGHASEKQDLPEGCKIAKVEIRNNDGRDWDGHLYGIRMTLDNGTRWGELHDEDSKDDHESDARTSVLVPGPDEEIVGFFGQSDRSSGWCSEFGIICAPSDRQLLSKVYDMQELRNTYDELESHDGSAEDSNCSVDEEMSEDEDEDEDKNEDENEDEDYDMAGSQQN